MVLRTARQGHNVGNQFYGCPNFPRCREVQPTEPARE
jgi:ssDNA-binding Zn-finger/Zn-ribbon topoisomerase 1